MANKKSLLDHAENFKELAVMCARQPGPKELGGYIAGLAALEATADFYGGYYAAAGTLIEATLDARREEYANWRDVWQANLDELKEAIVIEEDQIHPHHSEDLLSALKVMEESKAAGFNADAFGDLEDEALAVQEQGLANVRLALARIAVMVVDPAIISENYGKNMPVPLMEYGLEKFKELPLTLDAFQGHADLLAEAKRLHPLSIAKQEARIKAAKDRIEGVVKNAIEEGEDHEHRIRVADASLSPEERQAREGRMREAATHLFNVVRRIPQVARIEEESAEGGMGLIDASGLLELTQTASALVMRVEGRLN